MAYRCRCRSTDTSRDADAIADPPVARLPAPPKGGAMSDEPPWSAHHSSLGLRAGTKPDAMSHEPTTAAHHSSPDVGVVLRRDAKPRTIVEVEHAPSGLGWTPDGDLLIVSIFCLMRSTSADG